MDKLREKKLKLNFRRFEFKYQITPGEQQRIRNQLKAYMRPDPYAGDGGEYQVTTLYYDSPALRYYYANEAGLKDRQKVRHRFYGGDSAKLFWEIKRKKGDVVLKDRCLADKPREVLVKELRFYTVLHRLRPVVYVCYWREPWVVPGSKLRVTFDRDLKAARVKRGLGLMPQWQERLLPGRVVMELKFSGRLPYWLYRIVVEHSLQRRAIGKYRLAVERLEMV